jgi:DNA-binding CsgD family transcriptional regulator
MISLVFIVLFFFSLAIAVVGVLVSYEFINNYKTSFLKNYFYYLISFYAFAIYAIWGQIIVRTLLVQSGSSMSVVEGTANFLPILGVPFLFVSWIMLINMAHSIYEVSVGRWWRIFHVVLFILLILGAWFGYSYIKGSSRFSPGVLKYFGVGFIDFLGLINYTAFVIVFYFFRHRKKIMGQALLDQFAWLLLVFFMLRSAAVLFSFSGTWILGLVILFYFVSNVVPLYFLRLKADYIFLPVMAEGANEDKLGRIFERYSISRREREIVKHICAGKTNQQIADELFISLQTVKDHTHRIYTKIGINSRMKLVQMANG